MRKDLSVVVTWIEACWVPKLSRNHGERNDGRGGGGGGSKMAAPGAYGET